MSFQKVKAIRDPVTGQNVLGTRCGHRHRTAEAAAKCPAMVWCGRDYVVIDCQTGHSVDGYPREQ